MCEDVCECAIDWLHYHTSLPKDYRNTLMYVCVPSKHSIKFYMKTVLAGICIIRLCILVAFITCKSQIGFRFVSQYREM